MSDPTALRISKRLGLLLLALLLCCSPAAAETVVLVNDETKEDFGVVDVGYAGFGSIYRPSPVTARIVNPFKTRMEMTLSLSSGRGGSPRRIQRSVVLDPAAEKILRFNFLVDGDLEISISAGGTVRMSETTTLTKLDDFNRRVLFVKGAEEKFQVEFSDNSRGYFAATISAKELPADAVCYSVFNLVVFQGTDPQSWSTEQREAFDLFLLHGGTALFSGVSPKALGVRSFWKSIPGTAEPLSTTLVGASSSVPVTLMRKRAGTGVVMLTGTELYAEFLRPNASQMQRSLSVMLGAAKNPTRSSFPRHFTERNREPASSFGLMLLVAYFIAYTLIVGPIITLAYRRKPRMELARAIFVVILTFLALAPAVALVVRSAPGALRVFSTIEFTERGEALQFSELRLASGGGKAYDLKVEGREVVAFLPSADAGRFHSRDRYYYGKRAPNLMASSYETRHGSDGKLELKRVGVEAWDRHSFFTFHRPKHAPLDVTFRWSGRGSKFLVKFVNTSPFDLVHPTISAVVGGKRRLRVLGKTIPSGASFSQQVSFDLSYSTHSLARAMRIPYEARWQQWARNLSSLRGRAWFAARAEGGGIKVSGGNVTLSSDRTIWVQAVAVQNPPPPPAAKVPSVWLGVKVRPCDDGRSGVIISQVISGSPAAQAGLQIDDLLVSLNGSAVSSTSRLLRILAAFKSKRRVRVKVQRGWNSYRSFYVKLASRKRR